MSRYRERSPVSVDRSRISPFLLRVFVDGTYTTSMPPPLATEIQLYTWKDATLIEIVTLILSTRQPPVGTTRYALKHVYYDNSQEKHSTRDLGFVHQRDVGGSAEESRSERKEGTRPQTGARTLDSIKFVEGDFIDINFLSGMNAGQPAPLSASLNGGISIRGSAPQQYDSMNKNRDRGDRDRGSFGNHSGGSGVWTRGGMAASNGRARGAGRRQSPIGAEKKDEDAEMQY